MVTQAVLALVTDNPFIVEAVMDFLQMMVAGLAGSPQMIHCTILALTRIIFEYRDVSVLSAHIILCNTIVATSPTRWIAAFKNCLAIMKYHIYELKLSERMVAGW